MYQTTKTISLVLISSALVFIGWGCPMGHEERKDGTTARSGSGSHGGSSWFWRSGYYGGGRVGPSAPTGTSTSHPGTVSSRGGFGSSGGAATS